MDKHRRTLHHDFGVRNLSWLILTYLQTNKKLQLPSLIHSLTLSLSIYTYVRMYVCVLISTAYLDEIKKLIEWKVGRTNVWTTKTRNSDM